MTSTGRDRARSISAGYWHAAALPLAAALLLVACRATALPKRPDPDLAAIREATGRGSSDSRYVSARALQHYLLAMIARDDGDGPRVIAELKLAALYDPPAPFPRFALASEHERTGDLVRADQAAREALLVEPLHAPSLVLLGRIALAQQKPAVALGHLRRAAAADPDGTEAFSLLIRAHLARKELAAALAVLDRLDGLALAAGERDDANGGRAQHQAAEALGAIAAALVTSGQFARGESLLRLAAEREPANPRRRVALAEFLEGRGRPREAAESWARAIAAAGVAPSYAASAGRLYLKAGDRAAALAYVDLLGAQTRDGVAGAIDSLLYLGYAFLEAQAYEAALEAFELAVAGAPDRADAQYYAGAAWEGLDRYDRALAAYRRVPESHTLARSAQVRAALCEHRLDQGDPVAKLEALMAAAPDSVETALTLARVLEEREQLERARRVLEPLAARAGPAVAVALARLESRSGLAEAGLARLEAALAANAHDDAFLQAVAAARADAGRLPQAMEALRVIVARSPGHAEALNLLAWLLAEANGALDEAEALATRALAIRPDSPPFLDTFGWILLRRGHVAQALEALERAARGAPTDPEIRAHLAEARARAGRVDEALRLYEEAATLAAAQGNAAVATRAARALEALRRPGIDAALTPAAP